MTKREKLLAKAREVALKAHCPYSHNRVGSALIAGGKIFTGVNVEISSYGHTLCAERSAIAAAISDGAGPITEIAVACIDVPVGDSINKRAPCRTCRQWIADLAPEAIVYIEGAQEEFYVSSHEWLKSCSRNAFQLEEASLSLWTVELK
ncbi:MAG TPA: cytidine deaminase [Methylomirabilota bacterium]|nr:cytidine deaminase [Methylomirabilota bacterium]